MHWLLTDDVNVWTNGPSKLSFKSENLKVVKITSLPHIIEKTIFTFILLVGGEKMQLVSYQEITKTDVITQIEFWLRHLHWSTRQWKHVI